MYRICSLYWVIIFQKFLSQNRYKRTDKQKEINLDLEKTDQHLHYSVPVKPMCDTAKAMFQPTVLKHLKLASLLQIFL